MRPGPTARSEARPGPTTSSEEVFLAYPADPIARKFRSTWLASSLKAARTGGHFDRYLQNLPQRYHDPVLHSVAGEWLPIDVAVAHYEALDKLALTEMDIVKIGEEVGHAFNNAVFQTILRLAQGAGLSPWTACRHAQKSWDRTWVGGGYGIFKLGERELGAEIVGWPCARFRYTRIALRGTYHATLRLFCRRVWVEELPEHCTDTTLGYRVHWV